MTAAVDAAVAMRAWEWPATGSTWRIHHSGGVDAVIARFLAEEVEYDEARWSRFRPTSDVSRITSGAGSPVAVDTETLDLVDEAIGWVAHTEGVFQPLVGGAVAAWGYRRSLSEEPAGADESPAGVRAVEGPIEVDRDAGRVRIPAGTRLDLGGIAKGYMARRAAALLAAVCGDEAVIVDAGGDLVTVSGDHAVAIENPSEPGGEPLQRVLVRAGQAIATSGHGRRRWRNRDGIEAHHLIDPATGSPGPRTHVSVIACDVVEADVVATAIAVRPELAARLAPVSALEVDGVRTETPGWAEAVLP